MRYISNDLAPKRWSDFIVNPIELELVKTYITNGAGKKDGLPRALYIMGPSGCGKTTYARLLMRSFRCLNRKDDEYEPCGECAYCLADNDERLQGLSEGDCVWVQPGMRSETVGAQVKIALQRARLGPALSDRPHRNVLWCVFDEWPYDKKIGVEVLGELEALPDYCNVCFIFLSMLKDNSDSQLSIAHDRRCSQIKLRHSSSSTIYNYLKEKFPELPSASLELIATHSKGSLGTALMRLDDVLQRDSLCSEEMTCYQLELCLPSQRQRIWKLVLGPWKKGYTKILKQVIEDIESFSSSSNLSQQLLEDILESLEDNADSELSPCTEHILAIDKLQEYRLFPERCSLLSILLYIGDIGRSLEQSTGRKLVDYDHATKWSNAETLGYANLKRD